MSEITVVRHGQTEFNKEHRWQGWLDSQLTELGKQQAIESAERLKQMHFDRIAVSPLGRAIETLDLIKSHIPSLNHIPTLILEELKERNVGYLQGIPTPEILQRFPAEMKMRFDNPLQWHPKDGESSMEFIERVKNAAYDLVTNYPNEKILVVAHGGVCAQWHRYFTNADPLEAWEYKIPNGAISTYKWNSSQWECLYTDIKPRDESMDWIAS